MTSTIIDPNVIEESNKQLLSQHRADFEALTGILLRRGVDIEKVITTASKFTLVVPSWGFSQGGTRFGRFPLPGEPQTIEEKLQDAAVVNQLICITPRVSLHIPWDRHDNFKMLRRYAGELGLEFDAINSNTFQDQPHQQYSYKFGSLSHTDAKVRQQAIEHNIECIEIGKQLGSKALSIWLADGSSFPGQLNFRKALERAILSLKAIYSRLPSNWRLLIEYKPFEPAFYSTTINDWGSAWLITQELGPQAFCLVDLGHHLPNTNIEQVVARLISVGKLGGFHFNDSKYADDDLSAGSIKPYQLFLIFNELVDATLDPSIRKKYGRFAPSYMIDQSHNIKDPIEDLIQSAIEIHRAYVKALLVDRVALINYQEKNDVVMAERTLKLAFETDVTPILAEIRLRKGGAIDPILVYRASKYRATVAKERTRR